MTPVLVIQVNNGEVDGAGNMSPHPGFHQFHQIQSFMFTIKGAKDNEHVLWIWLRWGRETGEKKQQDGENREPPLSKKLPDARASRATALRLDLHFPPISSTDTPYAGATLPQYARGHK